MIKQITVFLENSEGRLAAVTRCLASANVNMLALTIAESSDYGLVRIICDEPEKGMEALKAGDFRATLSKVSAIEVPNRPGAVADLLAVLDDCSLNIEYGYCFSLGAERAVDVFKIAGDAKTAEATFKLEEAGFRVISNQDLS